MKKQNSNQIGKAEKVVILVKTFDHYHHKFHIFQLPCKISIWNWNLEQNLIMTLVIIVYLHNGLKSFIAILR